MASQSKLRILILTWGSMGDVVPLVALARRLMSHGHDIVFGASSFFAPLVQSHGVPFRPIGTPINQARYDEIMDTIRAETNPRRQMRYLLQQVLLSDLDRQYADSRMLMSDIDIVVCHWMQVAGFMAAEKDAKPLVTVTFNPIGIGCISDRRYPQAAPQNARSNNIGQALTDFLWGMEAHEFRRRIGLRTVASVTDIQYSSGLNLVAVSRHLLPEHAAWSHNHQPVGFWYMDEQTAWCPGGQLQDFLSKDDKPIVISFGSMSGTDQTRTTQILVDAVKRTGRRAILQSGWAGLGKINLPHNILKIDYAPHSWLFARAACVIHHGGAGTTAAALKAGVPSIITWHMLDQPYWGNLLAQMELGPKPIARPEMTVDVLSEQIVRILQDDVYGPACRAMAEKIGREGGVEQAARLVEKMAARALCWEGKQN